jgi:hypothetical protein
LLWKKFKDGVIEKEKMDEIEKSFVEFAKALLERLKSWAQDEEVPTSFKSWVRFQDGGMTREIRQESNCSGLMAKHYNDILAMREANNCAKVHLKKEILKKEILKVLQLSNKNGTRIENPTLEQVKSFLISQLASPLFERLYLCNTLDFVDDEILKFYCSWFNFLEQESEKLCVTAPLVNFSLENTDKSEDIDRPIWETGTLTLSKFTDNEKTELWNKKILWNPFSTRQLIPDALSKISFKIAGSYERDQSNKNDSPTFYKELASFIIACRLFKKGLVGVYHAFEDNGRSIILRENELLNYNILGNPFGSYLTLKADELPQVTKIFNYIKKIGQWKGLEVAIRRFNQSYARELGEDRIIDLTIALESCLLSGVEDELQYRLALRAAALLGDKPKETQLFLKVAYEVRSQIVHNGMLLNQANKRLNKIESNLTPEEFQIRYEDIVRKILNEYIVRLEAKDEKSVAKINENLDAHILDSLRTKKDE